MAADDQRGGDPGRGALHVDGELAEVFWVVAQLDPAPDQRRVDLVAVAGQADGGGLGHHPGRRPAKRLGEQDRVGGPGRPASQEPGDRWLAGLGVDSGVAHLLGPGGEAVVQFVQGGDAGGLGLKQEPLADDAVESLLLAAALGPIWLAVHQSDAQHRATALQRLVGVGRAVVHIQHLGQPAAHDRRPQHVLTGAGVLPGHPAPVHQQPGVVVHQQKQLGALGASHPRVGHERTLQHVPDPALVGPFGLIATEGVGGLGGQCGPVQALAPQVGADGALADGDAVAGAQDVGDVGGAAGWALGAQRGRLGQQLGVAAHLADVSPLDRAQPLQAAGLVGGDPAVQRATAIAADAAIGVLVGAGGERAHQPAALGR